MSRSTARTSRNGGAFTPIDPVRRRSRPPQAEGCFPATRSKRSARWPLFPAENADAIREAERWGRNADALERKLRDGSAAGPLRSARASLARAREALTDVDAGAGDARDRVRAATRQIDKVTQAVRDVRADVDPVRRGVEQVEREGLGGKPELPDYEPDRSK